jgi:2-dehydro-3-deoxy-D-arabinonate dehydratase
VVRDGETAYEGETSTARLHRTLEELVATLFEPTDFPDGAVLSTGTGIVPEMSFTLTEGDTVEIEIAQVGTLSNPVVRGREPMTWLVDALERPEARRKVQS